MQSDQPIHHTIQNEDRAQMPQTGCDKSKQREIGRNRQQSLYIIQKRKLINKKVLKARIKKQAISKRIRNIAKPSPFDKNEEIVPQDTNYPSQSLTNQKFASFIKNHAENVTCPICLTELIQPIATKCAHLFCLQCIEKSLQTSTNCPLCRQTIPDDDNFWLNFDKQAQKLVRLCNKYSSNEKKQAHLQSYLEWKTKRILTQQQIRLEKPIDVWALQGKWFHGTIKQIYYNQENKIESLLVDIRKNTVWIFKASETLLLQKIGCDENAATWQYQSLKSFRQDEKSVYYSGYFLERPGRTQNNVLKEKLKRMQPFLIFSDLRVKCYPEPISSQIATEMKTASSQETYNLQQELRTHNHKHQIQVDQTPNKTIPSSNNQTPNNSMEIPLSELRIY